MSPLRQAPLCLEVPQYSAIVLYFRLGEDVRSTLTNLLDQSYPPAEVVVVDNCSADGVLPNLAADFPTVRFVYSSKNVGYAAGMNLGYKHLVSDTQLVAFLTHETTLEFDCIEQMITAIQTWPRRVALAAPVLTTEGKDCVWSSGGKMTRWGAARHTTDLPSDDRVTEWADGACLMCDRAAFEQAQGFDDRFFLYWEDVDLCIRLARIGDVIVARSARADQSTGSMPPYFSARNRTVFWRKHGPLPLALASCASAVTRVMLRDIWTRRGRSGARSRLRGLRDAYTHELSYEHFKAK